MCRIVGAGICFGPEIFDLPAQIGRMAGKGPAQGHGGVIAGKDDAIQTAFLLRCGALAGLTLPNPTLIEAYEQ